MEGKNKYNKQKYNMEEIKKEINNIFDGKIKSSFHYATKEFPENYENIFESSKKAFHLESKSRDNDNRRNISFAIS